MSEHDHDLSVGRFQAGYLRFVPAVTFGLRAAALAGLVVSTGVMATGLFDEPGGIAAAFGMGSTTGSTCCRPDPD